MRRQTPNPIFSLSGKIIRGSYLLLTCFHHNTCIVRTEGVNDTPDVEMTETPTDVFGFSLNDKTWCTF